MIQKHDADLVLQTAIVARLKTDITTVKIHNTVPTGEKMPYINVGESFGADTSGKVLESESVIYTIHVWDNGPGAKTAKEIRGKVIESITKSYLDLSAGGFYLSDCSIEYKDCMTDEDGQTQHAVVRIKFEVQKT